MAQNGFALFFLLVLAGGAVSLVASLRASWKPILAAILAKPDAAQRPLAYRAWQRRPIDVPEVARRMVLKDLSEEPAARPMPRPHRHHGRRNSQLAFDLAC